MTASIMPGVSREILHVRAWIAEAERQERCYLESYAKKPETKKASREKLKRIHAALVRCDAAIEQMYLGRESE